MVKLDLFTNQNLQTLNTLAVPCIAGNYLRVSTVDEVKQALQIAKELNLPQLILGGGSNLILPDMFPGLIIHITIAGMEVVDETEEHVWIKVGAGENWHDLVEHCLNFHYWGIENLALIPGTVGAAPIQNIGAYGVELDTVFEELNAVEKQSQIEVTFDRDGCQFGYRDSIFKNDMRDRYIVTHVTFKLNKTPAVCIKYPALKEALSQYPSDEISPRLVADTIIKIRQEKLPNPEEIPNVGSFFKNPIVDENKVTELLKRFPDLVKFPMENGLYKLAAAWLIDQAGWKGKEEYGVGVHSKQALVVVNPGKKSGQQVLELAQKIKTSVEQQFGVVLEIEPINYCSTSYSSPRV